MPSRLTRVRRVSRRTALEDGTFPMAFTDQFPSKGRDPLLAQAEKILSQRQKRTLVIDRDLLGEPGWDILLCAFIAARKGEACALADVAQTIDLGLATTRRWADALTERGFIGQREGLLEISVDAEAKLAAMFKKQLAEIIEALGVGQETGQPGTR